MPTPDVVDPTIEAADRRAERAKPSQLDRVEVLKQRVNDAKHKLDISSQIAHHAWPAVGVAFALGVAAAFGRKGSAPATHHHLLKVQPKKKTVGDMVFGAAASLGIRLVRDAALGQLSELARQWWTQHGVGPAAGATKSRVATGRTADLAPFLER